jgi:hypothetical protein
MRDQRRETQRKMTYILQCAAVALMLSAIILGHMAAVAGKTDTVVFSVIIFAANMGLFIWQNRIRAGLQ